MWALLLVRFRRLVRHRHFQRLATVGAVAMTFAVLQRAETTRMRWGTPVSIVEVVRTIERGTQISANDVRVSEQPLTAWRSGMSSQPSDVVGRRATERLRKGDTIILERTRTDQSGVAARLNADERGVAIAVTDALPALRVGDRVSLVDAAGGVEVTGTVIDQSDRVVTVGVAESSVATVTAAIQRSSIAIVLRP